MSTLKHNYFVEATAFKLRASVLLHSINSLKDDLLSFQVQIGVDFTDLNKSLVQSEDALLNFIDNVDK